MTTEVRVLADGLQLGEGPRVDDQGRVWFTNVLGGGVYRWSEGSGVETMVPKRKGVGGLALHADGGVVVSGRDIVHVQADGTNRLLFSAPEGVTGFNDIGATVEGNLLVGGLRFRPFAGEDTVPGSFWHVAGPEQGDEVLTDVHWPNGVGDADGTWCFCDYARGTVTLLHGDEPRRVISTPNGEADGLAIDGQGGIWVALAGGEAIARFTQDGELTDTVELPGHMVTSLAFDGASTMYVTTREALLSMPAPVPGPRHHLCRV
jgi:gluconolactonase